jgi:hypothetical protein
MVGSQLCSDLFGNLTYVTAGRPMCDDVGSQVVHAVAGLTVDAGEETEA